MHYTIPNYYGEFSCVADRCADTCCAGWEIAIDPASLARLGNRLHNSIAWKKGSFKQYDGRCAFLDESGLCDLYAEGGPGMLCRTCRTYPRHVEEFEGVREISLCISCIEAARIVLGQKEPVHFLEFDREGREEDYGDFDFLLYTKLTDARELALRILQNRRRPAGEQMAMALALAHDLQSRIDRNALFAADALFERYGGGAGAIRGPGGGHGRLVQVPVRHVFLHDRRFGTPGGAEGGLAGTARGHPRGVIWAGFGGLCARPAGIRAVLRGDGLGALERAAGGVFCVYLLLRRGLRREGLRADEVCGLKRAYHRGAGLRRL